MIGWLYRIFGFSRAPREVDSMLAEHQELIARNQAAERAAQVGEQHFTQYTSQVKQLKREGRHNEAIALLVRLIDAAEAEARVKGGDWFAPPWYYQQLAIVYRKEKRYEDEVVILERFAAQVEHLGSDLSYNRARIEKARDLQRKSSRH